MPEGDACGDEDLELEGELLMNVRVSVMYGSSGEVVGCAIFI